MTTTITLTEAAEKLKPVLSSLPTCDRIGLAEFLYESVDDAIPEEQLQAEWEVELNRRMAEVESGLEEGIPSEEVHRIVREGI